MSKTSLLTPYQRLILLLKDDKRDLITLLIYTVLSGSLSLVIPLTAKSLVNTIAAGVFLQPLAVLTLILFVVLLFVGAFRLCQFYLVEFIQQRVFAKVALELSDKTASINHKAWRDQYLPEVLNRFFDVVKIQKTLSKLLLDAPAALLQITVGLILMAIYSPVLLGFNLVIIAFIIFVTFVLGRHGVKTSIQESSEKYRVASWLEEIAKCHTSFKMDGAPEFFYNRTDNRVIDYLSSRKKHFKILFRQTVATYFFQAIATAGIFGIGGWLVIERQLTLGQLVASELVILILLAALEKLVILFQDWYDLLTGLHKIGQITDLPGERKGGIPIPYNPKGVSINCYGVSFEYEPNREILSNLTFSINPGELVSIVGPSGAGKTTLAAILTGLLDPKEGLIELNGIDLKTIDLDTLRESVALVSDNNETFEGTIEENIKVGRHYLSQQDIRKAIEMAELQTKIRELPDGMETKLLSHGFRLSRGQRQKLLIARGIVNTPKLLILDEAFTGIDERKKIKILDNLLDPQNQWTVIDISHDADVVMRSTKMIVLNNNKIIETGDPKTLINDEDSAFASLFPGLASRFKRSL